MQGEHVKGKKISLRSRLYFSHVNILHYIPICQTLQKQADELLKENEMLKSMVKAQASEDITENDAITIIPSYGSASSRGSVSAPTITNVNLHLSSINSAMSALSNDDRRLLKIIQASQCSYCITNPKLMDNPIIYANKRFLDLTGYKIEQVLGKNCRFLQGPDTDKRQIEALKKGIVLGIDTSVCLLNYKADGSTFSNQLFFAALRDVKNIIINYVGVQVQVFHDVYSMQAGLCP